MKIIRQLALITGFILAPIPSMSAQISQSKAEAIVAEHHHKALEIYNQLKSKYIENTDPLIIAWGNRLAFYHNHQEQDYPIVSEEYNELKGIAHVSLAVFALFDALNQFPKNSNQLKSYKQLVINTQNAIDALSLSVQQKERQKAILSLTRELLTKAMAKSHCSQQDLAEFFKVVSPLIKQNINEATKIELSLLNQQMTKIQKQMSPEERKKLFVIIPVPKMPREGNIVGQYFSKYLNTPVESKRLIYAEGLTETQAVLALVGTWQIESLLSSSFFLDSERMKKDLVSDNARDYLQHCKIDTTNRVALLCG